MNDNDDAMWDDEDWDDEDEEWDDATDAVSPWGLFNQGMHLRERDLDASLAKMFEGRDKALASGEASAAFYMNHWILQTLITKKEDYNAAYDLAVQTAAESHLPAYENMQERICVFQDLILVYLGKDPLGHAELIEQAIQEMNSRITRPVNCKFCMQGLRCEFEIVKGDLNAAEAATYQYLAMSEQQNERYHYGVQAHARMCEVVYARRDWRQMIHFATVGDQWGRSNSSLAEHMVFFQACLALAHRRLGRESEAQTYYRLAVSRASTVAANMLKAYYDVLCDFHEMEGELQAAVNLRDRELDEIRGKGALYREARSRLERARLLKQLGQPIDQHLADAEQVIARLKKPAPLLEQAEQLRTT
jgi:hypothetical protein